MYRGAAVVVLALSLAACGSISDNAKVDIIPPELVIQQVGGVAPVSTNVTGPIPLNYEVAVTNRSGDPITLQRIEVTSMGSGAYGVGPISRPFNVEIAPQMTQNVKFWLPVQVNDTILGANGPVTLRVVANFNSSVGQFQKIYIENVNTSATQRPPG